MSKKIQVIGLYAVNTKKIVFRDINSNSAGETEEHIERQEKVKSSECENMGKNESLFQFNYIAIVKLLVITAQCCVIYVEET